MEQLTIAFSAYRRGIGDVEGGLVRVYCVFAKEGDSTNFNRPVSITDRRAPLKFE